MTPSKSETSSRINEDIDNYEYVCHTIVSISNIIEYNLKGECFQGKKLFTSNNNSIIPNNYITPDIVAEINQTTNSSSYRLLIEIKADLPKDRKYWKEVVEQLKKYDDVLAGWKYNTDVEHDLMFVTNPLRTYDFQLYIDNPDSTGSYKWKFERSLSIIDCSKMEQANTFMLVKKHHGNIRNEKLNNLMSRSMGIPRLKIINEINQMKFYDSEPPALYMIMIMWSHIFKIFL